MVGLINVWMKIQREFLAATHLRRMATIIMLKPIAMDCPVGTDLHGLQLIVNMNSLLQPGKNSS